MNPPLNPNQYQESQVYRQWLEDQLTACESRLSRLPKYSAEHTMEYQRASILGECLRQFARLSAEARLQDTDQDNF